MKYCEYCNEYYNDNLWKCPKCGQFLSKKTTHKSKGGVMFAVILVIIVLIILPKGCSEKGYWGSDGYYHPSQEELEDAVKDAQDWVRDNW